MSMLADVSRGRSRRIDLHDLRRVVKFPAAINYRLKHEGPHSEANSEISRHDRQIPQLNTDWTRHREVSPHRSLLQITVGTPPHCN